MRAGRWSAFQPWRCLPWLLLAVLSAARPAGAASGVTAPGTAVRCPGPVLVWQPLAPGVWWLPSATGDSDGRNRGQVSNLVLVREAAQGPAPARWWLVGSGPSPAFGRALACRLRQQLGAQVTDVISPWARPELVLGVAGLRRTDGGPPLRHWAHADVAQAMASQCAHCVDRLRLRIGQPAAADLDGDPVRLPDRLLHGAQGRLGPFDWWRLPRSADRWLTVWRLTLPGRPPLWLAHGLLQGSGPPDGRDADLATLGQSAAQLALLSAPEACDAPVARFVGEQGPLLAAEAPSVHARYWKALLQHAEAAVLRGDDETAPAPAWPGLPTGWGGAPWHALNWQRAWRQAEEAVLAAPALPASSAASR